MDWVCAIADEMAMTWGIGPLVALEVRMMMNLVRGVRLENEAWTFP